MKKTTIIILTTILLLISGCGTKVPYKTQEPLDNTSLVYIYVTSTNGFGENITTSTYQVHINNKKIKQQIKEDEYIAFNLKPNTTSFSITRAQIEERTLKLHLENRKIYYLRVKTDIDDGGFEFEEVKNSIGMQEIVKTTLAGATLENKDAKLTELVEPKKTDKIDEIKKAHELKEQGIITKEEFEKLKKEILAK